MPRGGSMNYQALRFWTITGMVTLTILTTLYDRV
jgi:hypothetical protein